MNLLISYLAESLQLRRLAPFPRCSTTTNWRTTSSKAVSSSEFRNRFSRPDFAAASTGDLDARSFLCCWGFRSQELLWGRPPGCRACRCSGASGPASPCPQPNSSCLGTWRAASSGARPWCDPGNVVGPNDPEVRGTCSSFGHGTRKSCRCVRPWRRSVFQAFRSPLCLLLLRISDEKLLKFVFFI